MKVRAVKKRFDNTNQLPVSDVEGGPNLPQRAAGK
jgi:hypothetical protein